MEEWKDIPGYEGCYEVSSEGRVRSVDREINKRRWNGIVKEPQLSKKGYLRIQLCKNNTGIHMAVHRLVALAFISNPDNKPTVDHIDRNPLNNKVSNLRWATHVENNDNKEKGKSNHKYIYQTKYDRYEVRVRSPLNIGTFKTIEEAIEARNNYLASID